MPRFQTIALVAHVDAGKTTFIEQALFQAGTIRKAGRVDHQDSFLDFEDLERQRGITIASKQVSLNWKDTNLQILDTPGHADFASEMEKNLPVLDAAILVISATEGIQSHTLTLWKVLEAYRIPVILFINKMDQSFEEKAEILNSLRGLDENLFDIEDPEQLEQVALLDEGLLEEFLEYGTFSKERLAELMQARKMVPVFFGSALKGDGIDTVLDFVNAFPARHYPEELGARVFSISESSPPLSHLKITGGHLQIKDTLPQGKINQIFQIQGNTRIPLQEARAGQIVAVSGLEESFIGQGLGFEKDRKPAMLDTHLQYELLPLEQKDLLGLIRFLEQLSKEQPSLQISISPDQRIFMNLHGAIQQDVLKEQIEARSGYKVAFGPSQISYAETITSPVLGIGHFEPLRHYAEVHVLLKPGKPGSGLKVINDLSHNDLSLIWQSSIMNSLQSYPHRGLLSGSPLTDLEIHLIAARASKAHSSNQDFLEASRRAVRHALAQSENIFLEPYIRFEIRLPAESLSRVLYDLETRQAEFKVDSEEATVRIKGKGALRLFQNYHNELLALTHGLASFTSFSDHYYPSKDQKALLEEIGYDWKKDTENPASSIFFAQGAGYAVDADLVRDLAHIQYKEAAVHSVSYGGTKIDKDQAQKAFQQAGGRNKKEDKRPKKKAKRVELENKEVYIKPKKPTVLIVDGYNLVYGWDSLKELRQDDLSAARDQLISDISNYAGYRNYEAIIVFDAYRSKDRLARSYQNGSVSVVFTRQNQSADAYIEKLVKDMHKTHSILAVTSDGLVQNSVFSHGGLRISAREMERRIKAVPTGL